MGIRKFIANTYEQKVINFICEAFKCNKTNKELMMGIKQCKANTPIKFYNENNEEISKLDPFNLLDDYNVMKRGKTWTSSMVSNIVKKF